MKIYLVRHGESLPVELDPEKGLSPEGKMEIEHFARFLGQKSFPLSKIYCSDKARARQTAEILQQAIAPDTKIVEKSGLHPTDPLDQLKELCLMDEDLMVVGHLPFLEKGVGYLVTGNENAKIVRFEAGTCVCLESNHGSWVIRWVISPQDVTSSRSK